MDLCLMIPRYFKIRNISYLMRHFLWVKFVSMQYPRHVPAISGHHNSPTYKSCRTDDPTDPPGADPKWNSLIHDPWELNFELSTRESWTIHPAVHQWVANRTISIPCNFFPHSIPEPWGNKLNEQSVQGTILPPIRFGCNTLDCLQGHVLRLYFSI